MLFISTAPSWRFIVMTKGVLHVYILISFDREDLKFAWQYYINEGNAVTMRIHAMYH